MYQMLHLVTDGFFDILILGWDMEQYICTIINVLLRSTNCSEAFPVWTQALFVIQFATLPFDFYQNEVPL